MKGVFTPSMRLYRHKEGNEHMKGMYQKHLSPNQTHTHKKSKKAGNMFTNESLLKTEMTGCCCNKGTFDMSCVIRGSLNLHF